MPPAGFGGAPGYGGMPQYEFSPLENQTIANAAKWTKFLSIILFVQAAFQLLNQQWFNALFPAGMGYLFLTGSQAFESVVNSAGNDMNHMMTAINKITTVFTIRVVLAGIAGVIFMIAMSVVMS